jgi:F-type H+-transporting ATPase subunit epsilon
VAFKIDVIAPRGVVLKEKEVSLLILPGGEGEFGIEGSHANLLAVLKPGEMRIVEKRGEAPQRFALSGGLVRAASDQVAVVADAVEPADAIDVERAQRALERAEERLKERAEDIDVERAKRARERALNRIRIAGAASGK